MFFGNLLYLQKYILYIELMDAIKNIFFKLIGNIKAHVPIIYLIVGLSAFIVTLFLSQEAHPILWKILSTLANITLISVFLSFLIDSAKYLNIFQDAITDVIYDAKFLSKRRDIQKIWERVSKAMFKSKFPQINHELLSAVKKNYLPQDDVSFYQDYFYSIDLKFDDKDKNYVHVTNEIRFLLVAENTQKIEFSSTNKIKCNDEKTKYECISFKVNNKIESVKTNSCIKDNFYVTETSVVLEGKTKYQIEETIQKVYSIKEDNFICFQAKWLIKNMRVQLFLPSNVSIQFVSSTLENEFKCIKTKENYCEYEYKGLLLRNQGFVIILNPKEISYE